MQWIFTIGSLPHQTKSDGVVKYFYLLLPPPEELLRDELLLDELLELELPDE